MIIYAADSVHGEGSGGFAEIVSFETAMPFPAQCCDRVITLTGSQRTLLHEIIDGALPMFEKRIGVKGMVLKAHVGQYALQSMKNKLELFLLDIVQPSPAYKQDKMNAVTDYMMQNIHRVLTLQEMADELAMSISSLKRFVQDTYSTSPSAYFTDLKIQEAKRLILHSPMNVTEIAQQLGFSSVHYFSRVFKQKTGYTPSQYKSIRRICRQCSRQ